LDVAEIADKYGLVVKETGLVDDVELLSDPIGALGVPMEVMSGGQRQRTLVPVGQMVFNRFTELKPYDPQTVQDMWGSQSSYLFWMTDKSDTRVPSFEECEDKVDNFIKQESAYQLAIADAEKAKAEVNQADNKTLSELFGTRAVPTGAFTWFTSFGSAQYSVPNGVTSAGEDFMSTAFALGKNEAGVAPNASKDTVYLIQAIQPTRSVAEVGEDFLANQYFKFKRIPNEAFQVGQRYTRDLSLVWNEELQKSMNFKFVDR
ncbi:MAG: hypothetical protein P8J27_08275, partial [Mariniblastus sp.]|nr:hypothetical protein [Mariniblastus sp.]